MTWPTHKLEPKQGESGIVGKKTETANEVLYFVLWDCAESNKTSNSLISEFANRCFFLYRFVLDCEVGIQHFWTYSSCSTHGNAVTLARDYDNFFVFLSSFSRILLVY